MLHFSTITRLDSLLIGSVLAMIVVQNPNYGIYSFVLKRAVPLMLMALGYILFDWPSDPFHSPLVQTIGYSIIAFGAAGSIMLFRLPQFDHSFLANGPIRYLGKISYGLYVYHWPCLYFVAILFTKYKLHGAIWSATFLTVTFVLNVVVAMISYHLFERAFLRLKDRFHSADSISLRTNVRPGDLAANPALASTSNELK